MSYFGYGQKFCQCWYYGLEGGSNKIQRSFLKQFASIPPDVTYKQQTSEPIEAQTPTITWHCLSQKVCPHYEENRWILISKKML